mgnify:CR=1 FL=1
MQLIKEGRNYSIINNYPRARIPNGFRDLLFYKIIKTILGPHFFISIVFVSEPKIKALNKKYRGLNASTDVLAFKLDYGGEIFFSINDIRKKIGNWKFEIGNWKSTYSRFQTAKQRSSGRS